MRAITFQGPGRVQCEQVPDPAIESPTDAIVRVDLCAICGSDMHVFHGRETGHDPGAAMGHEFMGEVVDTGADVRHLRVGDRVASPFTTSCGGCFYCRTGLTARCCLGALFGWVEGGQGLPGAQAEFVRVPLADSTLVRVPEGVSDSAALLAGDVLATGMFCAENGGVEPGQTVAVIGCGPVGLMGVLGAVHRGAERVFAVDSVAERLALAAAFGATPIDRSAAAPADVIGAATDGRGADVVLELVGTPEALRAALELVRPGGTISAVGVHTAPTFPFSPAEAYDKNLTLRVGRCPARRMMEQVLPLLQAGALDPSPILTHTLPLSEGSRGYEMFDRKTEGCVKVALTPGSLPS